MKRHFIVQNTQMENKHMKKCLTPSVIGEMQINFTINYYTPIRKTNIENRTGAVSQRWSACLVCSRPCIKISRTAKQ
jgi:hypothetical protein